MKRFLLGIVVFLTLTFSSLPALNAISIEPQVSADHREDYSLRSLSTG